MNISPIERRALSELQNSRDNLLCMPIEGTSDDIEGNLVDVPANLTVDFLRNHILVEKGALGSQYTIPEVTVGGAISTNIPSSLKESIKQLVQKRSHFISQPDSSNRLHVFLVRSHEGS